MIEPKCPHFGDCGGCRSQNLPYDEQLKQKHLFLSNLYQREIEPFIACENPWRYRNKMEFSFSQSKAKERFLGLMRRGARGRVVSLDICYLVNAWMSEALKRVKQWWIKSELDAYHPFKNQGSLRTLMLREGMHTQEKMAVLTISGNPSDSISQEQEAALVEALAEAAAFYSIILRKQVIAKNQPTRMEERILYGEDHIHEILHDASGRPFRFKIRAASFFQPNTYQAQKMYQKVIEMADIRANSLVFDLYCGTGSLGMFASSQAGKVLGVEIVPEAIQDAQDNLRLNGISNMEVIRADVQDILQDVSMVPDIVIVDPPRAGLSPKSIQHLKQLSAPKIIYVSCNPTSQEANCKELMDAGYSLERIQPIDQFPHTPHIEVIASLKRRD